MSDDIRVAIGTLLESDSELADLAPGGVHFVMVTDQELEGPFCIFHLDTGSEEWAMGGSGIEHDSWIVKGAAEDPGAAEAIDARCRELLDNVDLGGRNLFFRRTGPISYGSAEYGEGHFYRGSSYRVSSDDE